MQEQSIANGGVTPFPTHDFDGAGLDSEITGAISAALAGAHSEGTRRSYGYALQPFVRYCLAMGVGYLPASPATVAAFIVHRALSVKPQTIQHGVTAISQAHILSALPDPCQSRLVRYTLRGISRQYGVTPRQARALDDAAIYAILATARLPRSFSRHDKHSRKLRESPEQARRRGDMDIAIALVMRDAGLRISEAVALTWDDIALWADGSGRLTIRRSKSDQFAAGAVVYLSRQAMAALDAIRPNVPTPGQRVFPFTTRTIQLRIAAMTRQAGLGEGYSGHSPRVGLAHKAADSSAPVSSILRQGRWKTTQMLASYTREIEAGSAARWLES